MEPFQVFDGAAILALGLSLIAEEERPSGGGVAVHAIEADREAVGTILLDDLLGGNVQIVVQGEEGGFIVQRNQGAVESGGAESGFKAGDAKEVVLGQGDAFDGEEFLRVDGLVDGDEVGAKAVDGFAVFDFDDGEVGSGEGVFAGVAGGAGFAFGGAGAGGVFGVGSVGGALFFGGHLSHV